MSLNITTDGTEACKDLKPHPSWAALRKVLHGLVVQKMHAVLDCDEPKRHFAAGYAACLRDVWMAFDSATEGTRLANHARPGSPRKEA